MKDYEINLPEGIKDGEETFTDRELSMLSNVLLNAIESLAKSRDAVTRFDIDATSINCAIKAYRDLNTKICGMMGGE